MRSRRVLLLIVSAIVLVLIGCWFAFSSGGGGKQKKIVISKETTYLLEPLTEDGYVDYIAALNAQNSEGVTPENNMMALLVQIGAADKVPRSERADFFKRLGTPEPEIPLCFVSLWDILDRPQDSGQEKALTARMERPWNATGEPILAKWMEQNARQLALLREALERPRIYIPIVSRDGTLISASTGNHNFWFDACRLLIAAAMKHAGEKKAELAAQDLALLRHAAAEISKEGVLGNRLLAGAIDSSVSRAEANLASSGSLSPLEAHKLQEQLRAAPSLRPIAEAFDRGERFTFLDCAAFLARHQGGASISPDNVLGKMDSLTYAAVNWNITLRSGNSFYDAIVVATTEPDLTKKESLVDDIEAIIAQQRSAAESWQDGLNRYLFSGKSPGTVAGERTSDFLFSILAEHPRSNLASETSAAMARDAADVAYALAIYRAEQGTYPDRLEMLVPKHLQAVPRDTWHVNGAPIRYRKENNRYVLYSVGPNGIDDGGEEKEHSDFGDYLFVNSQNE